MINKNFVKLFGKDTSVAKELNLNLSKRAEELSNEISNIFSEAQNRYVNTENADSVSFILFQKKIRDLYDLCIK